MNESRAILGLDPSTVATGWCLLHVDGHGEGVIASGVWHPRCRDTDRRLAAAFRWMRGAMDVHEPAAVAIETPFYRMNAKTLITLAMLAGALRTAAALEGLPVVEIAPAARCTAVGLAGNASKAQVLATVNAVYNLNLTNHNEADAVAVAAAAAMAQTQAEWEAYA